MARDRKPGHITDELSRNFGLEVTVSPRIPSGSNPGLYPSGDPHNLGMSAPGTNQASGNFRNPIPPGSIGTPDDGHENMRPAQQYVDTVAHYQGEDRDPSLHSSVAALRSADRSITLNEYAPTFQPRRMPMPRAAQDEGYLGPYGAMNADPLMTDQDSTELFMKRDIGKKSLLGPNRDGMPHNDNADPTEQEQAQLSARRGQAAASLPQDQRKDYIAAQGNTSSTKTRVGYNKMSQKTAEKGY